MYFKEKMKQIDIATKLGVSKYKVSRVISKDPRSKDEKENRKIENKKKNIEYTKSYMKQKWANREQDTLERIENLLSDDKIKNAIRKLQEKKTQLETKLDSLLNLMIDGTIDKEIFTNKKI